MKRAWIHFKFMIAFLLLPFVVGASEAKRTFNNSRIISGIIYQWKRMNRLYRKFKDNQ